MQKKLIGLFAISLTLFACEKKNDPETFPVTFDSKSIKVTSISKVDTLIGSDSTYAEITINASKVTSLNEIAYDANNQLKYDAKIAFAYNAVKQVSGISFNAPFEQQVNVVYQNNERTVKYTYKNKADFQWDDSTITYSLPVAESLQPSSAIINYYWVNGSAKVAYRQQDRITFNYSGNNLSQILVFNEGVVDSIFDSSLSPERTNYDTTQAIIYAVDTVPMLKTKYRYTSQGRVDPVQAYFPLFYFGFEDYHITGSNYPKQIYREDYEDGVVSSVEYISYVYINDVVTGEIQTIQEHHSNNSAVVNQGNLRVSHYFKRD